MTDFFNAYFNPNKFAVDLPMQKLIADDKVDIIGVERFKKKIKSGDPIRSIVVVKHPRKDFFAVLDGHHRFWAYKELGYNSIKCAIVEDYIGLGYFITKEGGFQPHPKITKHVRIPLKRYNRYLIDYINRYKNNYF